MNVDFRELEQFEYYCNQLYTTCDPNIRIESEKACSSLCDRANCPAICQQLLHYSDSCYTQLVAATALTKFLSNKNTIISHSTRFELRDFALQYLASQINAENFVQQAFITLVCRLTKLGWLDCSDRNTGFCDILECASKFLESGQPKVTLIGVRILNEIIMEMNHNTEFDMTCAVYLHRKRSSSFRDSVLLPIFRIGLNLLKDVSENLSTLNLSNPEQHSLVLQSLKLVQSCLSYDFIGSTAGMSSANYESSVGGLVIVHIPTSWRLIFLDSTTIPLFFGLYKNLSSDLSSMVLSCLTQVASIRRSLFNNVERVNFLTQLVAGICDILTNYKATLNDPNVYHEFCRFLAQLKSNYQLTELVSLSNYHEFIRVITMLSVSSLKSFDEKHNHNSIHYLLSFWQRVVASLSYVGSSDSHLLFDLVPQISCAFIQYCLQTTVKNDAHETSNHFSPVWNFNGNKSTRHEPSNSSLPTTVADCPLDDWVTLSQQLEQFGVIGRCEYGKTSRLISELFDKSAVCFGKSLEMFDANTDCLQQISPADENCLAWLVYMIASLIGSRINYTSVDDECDGELICRVLQLSQLVSRCLTYLLQYAKTNPSIKLLSRFTQRRGIIRLELAILHFFEKFRQIYVGENVGRLSKVYQFLSDKLNISDELAVLGVFADKISTNLQCWSNCEIILQHTLQLFSELSMGYSAMRKLLQIEQIQLMLDNHKQDVFPFISNEQSRVDSSLFRLRTIFYASLSRLLMVECGEDETRFLHFISPLTKVANQLVDALLIGDPVSSDEQSLKFTLIQFAYDLRGISSSLNAKVSYQMLMDWFYPTGFLLFTRALEIWPLDHLITVPIFKTITELMHNRNGRLLYDSTIPTTYLFFIHISKILKDFGVNIITNTHDLSKDVVYRLKLRPTIAALDTLRTCISASLMNFGVFTLFHDNSLEKALEIGIQLLLTLSSSELQAYPKVAKSYFSLLEHLLNEHIIFVASFDNQVLYHFVENMLNNLSALDLAICESCCLCLDYLCTNLFKLVYRSNCVNRTHTDQLYLKPIGGTPNMNNPKTGTADCAVWATRATIASTNLYSLLAFPQSVVTTNNPRGANITVSPGMQSGMRDQNGDPNVQLSLLRRILVVLLSSVVQEECRCQWSISRPLLPLILLNKEYFVELKRSVVASLPADNQEAVTGMFEKLLEDVEDHLGAKNRDKFTQNISTFKHALSDLIKGMNAKPEPNITEPSDQNETPACDYLCLGNAILRVAGL